MKTRVTLKSANDQIYLQRHIDTFVRLKGKQLLQTCGKGV